jgi:hypothetical protein
LYQSLSLGDNRSGTMTSKRSYTPIFRNAVASSTLVLGALVLAGCPATQFFNEGPGQPNGRNSGMAPSSSVGACKLSRSKRPPLVNPALWKNLRVCNAKTPRRYLRLGYGSLFSKDPLADGRVGNIMTALREGEQNPDGNARMLGMLRTVRRYAEQDTKLSARVERASGRTFACDYRYLLNTTERAYGNVSGSDCPAYAWDPKGKRDVCLFDVKEKQAKWLTSAWSCMAFTGALGEGSSCYRMCAYNDYCAAQVNCAAPDFDLTLCAVGVCLPEEVAGILR